MDIAFARQYPKFKYLKNRNCLLVAPKVNRRVMYLVNKIPVTLASLEGQSVYHSPLVEVVW